MHYNTSILGYFEFNSIAMVKLVETLLPMCKFCFFYLLFILYFQLHKIRCFSVLQPIVGPLPFGSVCSVFVKYIMEMFELYLIL